MRFIILLSLLVFLAGCGQVQPVGFDLGGGKPIVSDDSVVNINNETTVDNLQPATLNANIDLENSNIEIPEVKNENNINANKNVILPKKFDLSVPFATQAPFANWDSFHEETCEEAAMIIADKYFKNQKLDPQIMEDELQKVVAWERQTFGYFEDTTAEESVKILKEYFGLKAEVDVNVTVDNIKRNLFAGNLILLPAAGRELHNPNFKGLGPLYHFVVVRGWDEGLLNDYFITNDPGTRKGEKYKYTYDVLINAIHDLPQSKVGEMGDPERILEGKKVMLIIEK